MAGHLLSNLMLSQLLLTLYAHDTEPLTKPAAITADIITPSRHETETHFPHNVAIAGDATIKKILNVNGNAHLNGKTTLNKINVTGNATLHGDTTLQGLTVAGDTNLNGKVITKPLLPLSQTGVRTIGSPRTDTTRTGQVSTDSLPGSVAFTPQGTFVAVANINSSSVQTFSVDTNGNLSSVVSSQSTDASPYSVAWSPNWSPSTGGFIAVINFDSDTVQVFGVDGSGNISSLISSQITGHNPTSVAWAPNWSETTGGLISIVAESDNTVELFSVDINGNLSSVISSQPTNNAPISVSWSPNWSPTTGGLIAITNNHGNTLQTFAVDINGNLSYVDTVQGCPQTGPGVFSPNGDFIAVAGQAGGMVQIFSVNNIGNLTQAATSSQMVGLVPTSLTWSPNWSDSTGGFIAIVNSLCNSIRIFSVDTLGHLSSSQIGYANTNSQPCATAWSPLGTYVAVTNAGNNTLQMFNATTL